MKTPEEINQAIEQLNQIAKTLKEKHQFANLSEYIAHAYTLTTLLWVLGEAPKLPILDMYSLFLKKEEK